jgi:hypothetical protein
LRRIKRLHLVVEQGSTEKTEKVYADVMKGISIKDQSAMEKFMTKAHNFHRPAILVAKLIDRLIPTWRSLLPTGQWLSFIPEEALVHMTAWLTHDVSDQEQYADLLKRLGFARFDNEYMIREDLLGLFTSSSSGKGDKRSRQAVDHIGRLSKAAFTMDLLPSVTSGPQRGKRSFNTTLYGGFLQCYNEWRSKSLWGFAFIDDEDPLEEILPDEFR